MTPGPDALRSIVQANQYLTLATADADGIPWASPVWFATADCREFLWVSSPEARHSRNLIVRPEVAIVVFDSRQRPGEGRGVYVAARAAEVADGELECALGIYSGVSVARGAHAWERSDITSPARLRLYRAVAQEHFVLDALDKRVRVQLG